MFSAKDLFFAKGPAAGGYTIAKSLRFRSSASAYLSRTFTTPTNNKIFTWSGWVKRGAFPASTTGIIGSGTSGSNYCYFGFQSGSTLNFQNNASAGNQINATTAAVFRDPSAWYHIVLAVDTTQATNSNGIKIYINGNQQTLTFGAYTQNTNTILNSAATHTLGDYISGGALYFDGYMAEVNFIDGQALDPTYFGQTDTATGVWSPKAYSGTGYGTNGFYLKFTDVGATSGSNTGYGKDFAGTNYWTTNNFGTTSTATTYDSMYDTPTNYDNGVTGAGNYAVLNPISKNASATLADGNLTYSGAYFAAGSILPTTGTWYGELTISGTITTSGWAFGVVAGAASFPLSLQPGAGGASNIFYVYAGSSATNVATWYNEATSSASKPIPYSGTTNYRIAIDATNGYIWLGDPTNWYDSTGGTTGNPATGANPTFTVSSPSTRNGYTIIVGSNAAGSTYYVNFGQRPFTYTPPTGFKALCTQNLPTPTIGATSSTLANSYFDISLWTGSGSNQNITNTAGFQPDFVWGKIRSGADLHVLANSVAGATKYLVSNSTQSETTDATTIASFNSNGFTVGTSTNLNRSTYTFVGWQWKANGSGSSNTSGSITSTVSANVTAGFSVVTYTGTSTTGTVGHGLGVAPKMIIVKARNTTYDWYVYHVAGGLNKYFYLNTTSAVVSASGYYDTVNSTVFGGTGAAGIMNTYNFVAYCFAEVAGYSKFGSYTGNGSTDGPFVYCGFRPRYLLLKRTDAVSDWVILDTSRSTYNVVNNTLWADLSSAESTAYSWLDILSNGFKLRDSANGMNTSSGTYIFAAFAESPFNYSRAR